MSILDPLCIEIKGVRPFTSTDLMVALQMSPMVLSVTVCVAMVDFA